MLGTSDAWSMSRLSHRPKRIILKIVGFLISAPDQPGRRQMYHYIREAKRLLSNIYIIYTVKELKKIDSRFAMHFIELYTTKVDSLMKTG